MSKIKFNPDKIRRRLLGQGVKDGFLYKLIIYAVLISVSYVFLYPLFKMISMTFMDKADIIDPEVLWVPSKLAFSNLKVAFYVLDFPKTFLSTLGFSTLLAALQTLVTSMAGYSLARHKFKYKNMWFVFILMAFVVPLPIIIIPRIMMFVYLQEATAIQMIGTIKPQLLMTMLGQGINSTIAILIFYNFFKMIPYSLDEAAQVDGASSLKVFYHIILKMSVAAVIIVFLFSFVWVWNETYLASNFARSGISLMSIRLGGFESEFSRMGSQIPGQAGEARINEAYKMAGTFLSMIPLLILYLIAQKHFIQGIENTGIKGE
ncbi:MAG: carbohydrate ABC transporter permease [Clostridia bacterium]